jgi:alpha-galactosidase
MSAEVLSRFQSNETTVFYHLDTTTGQVGLMLCPTTLVDRMVPHRETLRGAPEIDVRPPWREFRAWQVDSLVQLKCQKDPYPGDFSQGRTLRNSASTLGLRYDSQRVATEGDRTTVTTILKSVHGFVCEHLLSWCSDDEALEVSTVFRNDTDRPITLEMLSSFSFGGITPFHPADSPNRLVVHRFRSAWCAEGRLESSPIERLHLERPWNAFAALSERFGQIGSMPVRGFFPFAAVEDTGAHVCWGAQLAWAGSWQMEVYRRDDLVTLSGGLADREFGHWLKTIQPSQSFETPKAYLAVAEGDLLTLCQRLTAMMQHGADLQPTIEADLPIVCNEWCTSWGNPTHENLLAMARRLADSETKYLVIDAGWFAGENGVWYREHGDWVPSRRAFPKGLPATATAIRDFGLIPGLWCEMETCGPDSTAFSMADHLLKRDGSPITVGDRRFWDLRDPFVHDYLSERVIDLLRTCNFGYLKVDYNETIGIGCDGAESLGEGLRQQIEGVYAFFRKIHNEMPDLVVENCSSGGHRLEPSMMALAAMGSASDAFELREIPVIGANLHYLILPRQSQIWSVLRKNDDAQRIVYSLAATFLGRMCLSGEIVELDESQWGLVKAGQRLYRQVWPIIKHGVSYRYGPELASYRHPQGWQAVLRVADDQERALVVVHAFDKPFPSYARFELPATRDWKLASVFPSNDQSPELKGYHLACPLKAPFSASVIYLES